MSQPLNREIPGNPFGIGGDRAGHKTVNRLKLIKRQMYGRASLVSCGIEYCGCISRPGCSTKFAGEPIFDVNACHFEPDHG